MEGSRVCLRADIDMPRYWNENSFRVIDEVKAVAKEFGKTPSQVALSWLLFDQRVASVIIGSRKIEQLSEGMESGEWDLPPEQYMRLSKVVPFAQGYPHEWIEITKGNTAGHEVSR